MKIDIYAHILPPKYWDALNKQSLPREIAGRFRHSATLWELEQRFRIMDRYDEYTQVLTFSNPPIESIAGPKEATELARAGNDELANIVAKYPHRFVAGVANLPMNNIEAALKETERAIKELGLKGVMVYTNINGKPLDSPEFMPLYEMMAHYDLPIWIHPRRDNTVADYSTETRSKYRLYGSLGWPYETELAMARLACSGVLEKYPNLKFITHHCGGGLPYFEPRIVSWLGAYMEQEPDSELSKLKKSPLEYMRAFYGDTALDGNTPALMCGYAFFGAEHILFGTDTPFGKEGGDFFVREVIKAVTEMAISKAEKEKIFHGNAKKLLHL